VDPAALLADLDTDQRSAVTAESHLVAVIAGAGSGKTRVLTRRIAWRIATEQADARHTLALTFTREAAGELRRRLSRLGIRERVEAGTFHSVMLAVLKQRWVDTGKAARTVVSDRRRLVGDVLDSSQRVGLDGLIKEIDWATARGVNADRYSAIARREGRKPHVGVERVAAVFGDFERMKRKRGVIDFDDVLGLVIRDMEYDREFADSLRWRFRHLLVDEAQDLNPLQHRLVDLLRTDRNDLFLVGDPAQAIYGFNGADPALLIDVEVRFPGVEVVRLPLNHRCTPQIVRAGVQVLSVANQPNKLLSHRGDGVPVEQLVGSDEAAEVRRAANEMLRIDPNLIRAGEVAVLARTNAQLARFAQALEAHGISVRRSATAAGSPLQAAVRQVTTLGSASLLRAWAHDTLDAYDTLVASRTEQALANSERDRRAAARANKTLEDLEAERRVAATLLDYLRDQQLGDGAGFRAWVAMTNPFDDESNGGVDLLSFHAAKGREWHTVFVTGVESSLVPHKSATTKEAKAEEARLLYVAVTRASDRLVLTRSERRGGYARTPSPFVVDLDFTEPAAAPLPRELHRKRRSQVDLTLSALRTWRNESARKADVLPSQLCSDRDLNSIASSKPTTVAELEANTSFGPIMAARLADQILPLVSQSISTITGA
jgi:DNA helicase-2/ATP-dependent DNA helicase PcrA